MTDPYADRRVSPRAEIEDTLFIKSISSSQLTGYDDDQKSASTVNISAHGIQAIIDFEVLVDSEIALWVNHEADNDRILVSGIIRWTKKTAGENKHLAGIELDADCVENMQKWLENHPLGES